MKSLLTLIIFLLLPINTFAEYNLKLRAREHFDTVKINFANNQTVHSTGIGPAINLWVEEPFKFSIGLSYSHMFIANVKETSLQLGSDTELANAGLEAKYFLMDDLGLFIRLGASSAQFTTKSTLGNLTGSELYYGLGWEFATLNNKLGIAFEYALRKATFNDISIDSTSPSIGLHFYGFI